jgi:1-acyl-sn-glycerol-3-phosphate acyltransferase
MRDVEWAYWLGRVLCYPLRLVFRIRRTGSDRVGRRGPVLLAVNHVSLLDPLLMLWLGECTRREVRFLAMAELWKIRVLRFFLVHTHQIPVERATIGAVASLEPAARALAAGECVCVFPEGGISSDLELMPGKTGVERLAAMTGVPVTPVGVWGTQRIHAKGRPVRPRFGVALTIAVGDPVHVARDEHPADATDRIMVAIAACVATARRIYPQHPAGGDDGWWVRSPDTAIAKPTSRDQEVSRWA